MLQLVLVAAWLIHVGRLPGSSADIMKVTIAPLKVKVSPNKSVTGFHNVTEKNFDNLREKLANLSESDYGMELTKSITNMMKIYDQTIYKELSETVGELREILVFGDGIMRKFERTMEEILRDMVRKAFVKFVKQVEGGIKKYNLDQKKISSDIGNLIKRMLGSNLTAEDSVTIDKTVTDFNILTNEILTY